jgi:rhodanese-related sulfurtransferase
MSNIAWRSRLLWTLLLLTMIPWFTGCSHQMAPPAASAEVKPQVAEDLDIKPLVRDFLANLPADEDRVQPQDVAGAKPFVVDVRQPEDYAKGFIDGAVNIRLRDLANSVQALPAMDKDIVVVCDTGYRAAIGVEILQILGYKKARSLDGGMQAWKLANLATITRPAPPRLAGQPPKINPKLQAALNYYLGYTLPVQEAAISPARLTEDRQRKSSEEDQSAWNIDQGPSILIGVDNLEEFNRLHLTSSAMNLPIRDLVDLTDKLSPTGVTVMGCMIPNVFPVEPKMTRFVVVSRTKHRAVLGMTAMQMLGFHFVSALDGDVLAWVTGKPTA